MGGAVSLLGPGLCPADSLLQLVSVSSPLTSLNLGDMTPQGRLQNIREGRATEVTGFIPSCFRSGNRSPGVQFSSVQLLSHVQFFATPWTAARQASLSITNSRSSLKLMSIESVMPSNHLILCRPLLLLPSIFPSIRVFSDESALCIMWPKDWSFSFNISPFNEYSGLISFRMDWLDLLAVQGTLESFL